MGGYKFATDGHYREQAWNSAVNDAKAAANFAATAVTDPGKAADDIGNAAGHAQHALETAYNEAEARGSAEIHVKDFMIRHQNMLALGDEDVQILRQLRDAGYQRWHSK